MLLIIAGLLLIGIRKEGRNYAEENEMMPVPTNEKERYMYSVNYFSSTWQNNQAIIYFNNLSGINYDLTGSVRYKYGDTVKIIHTENF